MAMKKMTLEVPEEAKEKARKLCEERDDIFTDGVRVLVLIHRNKKGSTCKNRHLSMRVSTSSEEFEDILAHFIWQADKSELELRVYASVNKRDYKKAVRDFKRQQLDVDYEEDNRLLNFYIKVKDRFISALMKPSSKGDSIFKYDIDIKDERNFQKFVRKLSEHTEVISTMPTPGGFHIFCKPFNHTLFDHTKYYADLQIDSLMMWYSENNY